MNSREIREMQEYIKNYTFTKDRSVVIDCFKKFATLTVKSVEDVFNITDNFTNFMLSSIRFFKCSNERKDYIVAKLAEFDFYLSEYLEQPRIDSHKAYTNILSEILPNGKNTRILDVGAGTLALSSLLMGDKTIKPIDAIDSDEFYIDSTLASKFNVNLKHKKFRPTHKTNRYDLLMGYAPCKGTYTLVENASKHNKPYFLKYCACGLPEEHKNQNIEIDWYNYLKEVDPSVQVYEGYIYNMDITKGQLDKLINKYGSQEDLRKKYKQATDFVDNLLDMFLMELAGSIFGDK